MDEDKLSTVCTAIIDALIRRVDTQVLASTDEAAQAVVYNANFDVCVEPGDIGYAATSNAALVLAASSHRWDLWC